MLCQFHQWWMVCMKNNRNKSLNVTTRVPRHSIELFDCEPWMEMSFVYTLATPIYKCIIVCGTAHWFYVTLVGISMKLNNAELQWKSSVWQIKESLVRWMHFAICETLVFRTWSNGVWVCVAGCMLLWIDATNGKQATHNTTTTQYDTLAAARLLKLLLVHYCNRLHLQRHSHIRYIYRW